MPPANTPAAASPTRTRSMSGSADSPSRTALATDPLSYLSSQGPPGVVSTHYTPADEAADEANANFLRESLETLDQVNISEPPRGTQIDTQRDPRRTVLPPTSPQQPPVAQQSRASPIRHDTPEDRSRRERLQRVLARLNRAHEPAASPSRGAYSNRTPSPQRQSLYDWAPAYAASRDREDIETILNELRRQRPETHPEILRVLSQSHMDAQRESNRTPAPPPNAVDSDGPTERRDRNRERERRRRDHEWVNLRARAAIHRSRQGSPGATDRMLRYVVERERSGVSEEEDRARAAGWTGSYRPSVNAEQTNTTTSSNGDSWLLAPPATDDHGTRRMVLDNFRQTTGENMPPRLPRIATPPSLGSGTRHTERASMFLENSLKYLDQLRHCGCYEEALSEAIDHGLATKEFFADKHDDFIMDLGELPLFNEISWIQPGAVFDGHQHATNSFSGLTHVPLNSTGHVIQQINPNFRYPNPGDDLDRTYPNLGNELNRAPGTPLVDPRTWVLRGGPPSNTHRTALTKHMDPAHDQWPVRVIIHAVDFTTMKIQGTMEAYDVPQHSVNMVGSRAQRAKAGKKHDPITTYVEGHIIDSLIHSFLTPNKHMIKKHGPYTTDPRNATPYTTLPSEIVFPSASAHIDATNWRKLPPFNELGSDDEVARVLLSRAQMVEINEKYVFMRWKERCFVHTKDDLCAEADRGGDQDRGHGLTISGFYYISLRRSDGVVEGLYFDPTSTPYQHLRLKGQGSGWPSFQLR